MLANPLTKIFGSRNQRLVKNMQKDVSKINAFEAEISALSDEQLRAKTDEFRDRIKNGEKIDELLSEAFAVVREVSVRTLGLRHFDVQMIGGMVQHQGKISEMRTGEGKTLVATLPSYLNCLDGSTVHIITVNDYLARRDAEWMGKIFSFLGLSVGVITSGQDPVAKREAYACDIVYGTNNEFGFDYLRDNMAFRGEDRSQRGLNYAIVDEVDSILIDEARTPLIISGPAEESTDLYIKINAIIPFLKRQEMEDGPGDYSLDEKARQAFLTEQGHETCERMLVEHKLLPAGSSLYDVANISLLHHVNAALRAHTLFQRDVDYILQNDDIIIIDEFTGRMMPGRRWSEGLHQAVEAKEGARVQQENQTLASITFQNYFRLYDKLAGMTGTADTEAPEFQQIYGLEVVVIPTHMDMVRDDRPDLVYRTTKEKFSAIVDGVRESNQKGTTGIARYGVHRGLGTPVGTDAERRPQTRGTECQAARARSPDHRPGRPARRGHHRHQHGGPRHRHRARRQPGERTGSRSGTTRRSGKPPKSDWQETAPAGSGLPAGCTSSAPSATNPGASTTSCAAGPAARVTRVLPDSTWRWKIA